MRAPRIVVVGAGLGGLTAAIALSAYGFHVEVHEQAPELREVGAGLTVSRGAQSVFAELGLLEQVYRRASVVGSLPFLHYRTGKVLDGAFDRSDGTVHDGTPKDVQIHRADLHGILADEFVRRAPGRLVLGHRLVGVDDHAGGPRLHFADGSTVDAELVIGADGLRSTVREILWGAQHPRFTGQVAYRCLVPGEVARPFVERVGRAAVYFGPDRVFNRYALRRGAIVNCVAIARTAAWLGEGWTTPAAPEELLALYEGWHPEVLGLIGSADPDGLRKWALYDRESLPRWRQGRVTLLGDAAHPMLPFLGLGSAMAIEDAIVLARALVANPDEDGLDAYERERRPRTAEVMQASRQEGLLVQGRDPELYDAASAPSRDARFYEFDARAPAT